MGRATVKLAIADPPYLGRAQRYYGVGGHGAGYGRLRADEHPEAADWDKEETHLNLVRYLQANYEAWAIAMTIHSIHVYSSAVEIGSSTGYRFGAWVKPDGSVPSGSRIQTSWEPVLFFIPKQRRIRSSGMNVNDHLSVRAGGLNFMGAKPQAWTRWVLDMLGYNPETDTVDDLFPGSGAIQKELAQGVLL
jgi:hypothetical protein